MLFICPRRLVPSGGKARFYIKILKSKGNYYRSKIFKWQKVYKAGFAAWNRLGDSMRRGFKT